jgi:hypothetical protein
LADGDFEHRERLLSTAEATGRRASMRARLVGIVAVIATVALAAFAANGFSGEGPDMRSVDTGYSTPRSDVHRVAAPSGPVSASRLAQASKKRKKPQFIFFETDPATVPAGGTDSGDFDCPQGKAITGYFFTTNTDTFLGLSAPTSLTSWAIGVTNNGGAPTESVLGIVCAKNVK